MLPEFRISNIIFVVSPCLASTRFFTPGPSAMSTILSQVPMVDVNRTTATMVKPPFVAILKVRAPASRYCDLVLSKLTWPLPFGPPTALYVGMVPTAALFLVEIDAKEGLGVRAMNLTHTAVEYGATHPPEVHVVMFCGLLFRAQQSVEFTVPASDLYPAGHCVHRGDPLTFANVSGAQDEHDVVAMES
jgi:hypothetical protein